MTYFYLRHTTSPTINYIVNSRILVFKRDSWFSKEENLDYLKKNIENNES